MKPLGIYWPRPELPAWASFACVPDWASDDELRACVALSRERGTRWVLYFGRDSFDDSVADTAREMRSRCDAVGLTPFIIAATYHEEPYANFAAGTFSRSLRWGRFDTANDEHYRAGIASLHAWWSAQHAAIVAEWPGRVILFVENFVHDGEQLGPRLWRPVPAHTTVIGGECYVTASASWDAVTHLVPGVSVSLDVVLSVAASYRPLVLIVQGFAQGEGDWAAGPSDETVRRTAQWLRQPSVLGAMVFNRPAIESPGFVPFDALPQRGAIEQALGVR